MGMMIKSTMFIVDSRAKVIRCAENTGKGIFPQGRSLLEGRVLSFVITVVLAPMVQASVTSRPCCSQDIMPVFRDLLASGSRLPIAEAEW